MQIVEPGSRTKATLQTLVLCSCLVAFLPPVFGQSRVLEEIIVTAEKRQADVQDVPVSIATLTGETVEELGVKDVRDLVSLLPNVGVGMLANNTIVNIRGIQTINVNIVGDPSATMHIDGVYQARSRGAHALFTDLERVEVLKGPQGTLAGRNSTAGNVNIVTRKPHYEFEAKAGLTFGNFDRIASEGVINLPIIEDQLAIRASISTDNRDGYLINDRVNDIKNADDADNLSARLKMLWEPIEDLSVQLTGYYSHFDEAGPQFVPFAIPFEGAATNLAGFAGPPLFIPIPTYLEDPSDPRVFSLDTQPVFKSEVYGITGEINWELPGEIKLTYIGNAHFDDVSNNTQDFDGLAAYRGVFGPFTSDTLHTSHELRLSSSYTSDSPWDWVLGLYYFKDDTQNTRDVIIAGSLFGPGSPPLAAFTFPDGDFDGESMAVFGDVKYRLSEQFELHGGLRYTDDEKESSTVRNVIGFPSGRGPFGFTTRTTFQEADSDSVDWRVGMSWYQNDNSMHYITVGTGYKSAGYSDAGSYDAEDVIAYEIGTKNQFFDDRIRLNASIFYNDYDSLQVSAIRTDSATGAPGLITDIAKGEVFGVEIDGAALVGEAGQIDFALGYLDAEYKDFIACDNTRFFCNTPALVTANEEVVSGNEIVKAPDWSLTVGAQYVFPLANWGSITPRIQFKYTDDHYLDHFNNDYARQDSYTRTDIFLTYASPDERLTVQGFVKNIEDEDVRNFLGAFPISLNAQYDAPQTYGVRMEYHWD